MDRYSWQDAGSSSGLSDILAAYLLGQLDQREVILKKRRVLLHPPPAAENALPAAAAGGFGSLSRTCVKGGSGAGAPAGV